MEYYDGTGADWDIVCYIDTLNGSGNFYGWSTGNTLNDRYPSVFATQGYAYIAWQGDVGGGDNDIMFSSSIDYGQNWGGIIDISNTTANEIYPRLSGYDQTIGVGYVYNGNRMQFNYSADFGGTWLNTPEYADNNSTAFGAYHAVALLYTSTFWHASWLDTRNTGTDGIEIYTSRRTLGQGDITHHPDRLVFDYSISFADGPFSEKYAYNREVNPIDDRLADMISRSSPGEKISVMVMLAKQLNYDWMTPRCEQMSITERRQFVIRECQQLANEDQKALLDYLAQMKKKGKVSDILSLWSTNTVACNATSDVIRELAKRQDVWFIGNNERVEIIGDESTPQPLPAPADITGREICWGVAKINADDVWGLGYTGTGVVVGHMDTGVNYNHGDLNDHIWDGSGFGFPNHGYDYTNEDNDPMDTDGHGTQTAGIVAGDGTNGSQTGVAPDAQIMCLKCDGFAADMAQAIQFGLTYGADLFSTSLGFSNPSNSTKNWGRGQANTIYQAGLVWTVAAGNGNGMGGHYTVPQDICTPADAPSPWYAPNGGNSATIGVGATTNFDVVDTYSSYGPTHWEATGSYNDYPHPPGLIKPDVAAPGSNCKSLDHSTNNGYDSGIYGTSFAQPHVAGTVALMLDRNPGLTPRQIDSLLQTTALDIHAAGRDTLSGRGRIDAYQAVLGISTGTKFGQLWVINQATATGILVVSNITKAQNKNWLVGVNPTAFNVPINDSVGVWVTTDTTGKGLNWGDNVYDTLLIWSNTLGDDNPERVTVLLRYMGWIGAEEKYELVIDPQTVLLSISPNPFKNSTELAYILPNKQKVNLTIYDASGRKVKTLVDGYQNAGEFAVAWSGNDDKGQPLAAGVYFGRFEFGGKVATNKLILMK
jgi:subtilisin family serine protease